MDYIMKVWTSLEEPLYQAAADHYYALMGIAGVDLAAKPIEIVALI